MTWRLRQTNRNALGQWAQRVAGFALAIDLRPIDKEIAPFAGWRLWRKFDTKIDLNTRKWYVDGGMVFMISLMTKICSKLLNKFI